MTEKAVALEAIRNLSEHATFAEIIETLSILESIRRRDAVINAAGSVIQTDKAEALEAIGALPEYATWDEIAEAVAIGAAIRRGREDIAAGRWYSQEQAEAMLDGWIARAANRSEHTMSGE